jgi:hypothetical protein
MITILSALVSLLSFRVRSRASLELGLIVLGHQVIVLRRQRPRRLQPLSTDRFKRNAEIRDLIPRISVPSGVIAVDAKALAMPSDHRRWFDE